MTQQPDHYDESWPPKAYKNLEFLNSPQARTIRVMCELTEPGVRFRKNQIHNTIVFFGSARLKSVAQAQQELQAVEADIARCGRTAELDKKLAQARITLKGAPYYDHAVELADRLTRWSLGIEEVRNRYHLMSGGGPGIMEATNLGAQRAGGNSIGLGISLPFEQGINPYCTPDLSFEFHYFFVRKYWFLYLAKAIVVFPGGFGTMDELFEMLTLIQTKKTLKHVPIVLFGAEFWKSLIHFDAFLEWGVISPEDIQLFRIIDSVDEAFTFLVDDLTGKQGT